MNVPLDRPTVSIAALFCVCCIFSVSLCWRQPAVESSLVLSEVEVNAVRGASACKVTRFADRRLTQQLEGPESRFGGQERDNIEWVTACTQKVVRKVNGDQMTSAYNINIWFAAHSYFSFIVFLFLEDFGVFRLGVPHSISKEIK